MIGHAGKRTTAELPQIDCRAWFKEGKLTADGPREYRIYGSSLSGACLHADAHFQRLELCLRRWANGKPFDWAHCTVRIIFTPCHYGGSRPWFCCPRSGCQRRVAVLHLASTEIACRKCLDLGYQSQRQNKGTRALEIARRSRLLLGGSINLTLPPPTRPKGMHAKTYHRLVSKITDADARFFAELSVTSLGKIAKL